ncbi:MAG: MBOAT family O-acyltransferase [Bacteroidota bacterium]|nr:MBOAT family O-acyltransferase [Bacteroidota bacterium]
MAAIPSYIIILFAAIIIDYYAALQIQKSESNNHRKRWLVLSIVATCALLFVFKYIDFFITNLNMFYSIFDYEQLKPYKILLPIGLSFHTFQSLSYVIEVYKKKYIAEKKLSDYALYVMFYPQLVAGPIERPQTLLAQIKKPKYFDYHNLKYGLTLMWWGFFKKMAIADHLSFFVDKLYDNPHSASGADSLMGIYFFAIQIYCDFSGYTDIARGAAKVMGFDLSLNFNKPYYATSFGNFWQRWHISLSTWFRDYIYIPLGGNKKRHIFNLIITFLISGLWHGANWTFVTWGGIHVLYLITEIYIKKIPIQLPKILKQIIVFHLVCLAWVFFRAANFNEVSAVFNSLIAHTYSKSSFFGNFENTIEFATVLLMIIIGFIIEFRYKVNPLFEAMDKRKVSVQYLFSVSAILILIFFGSFIKPQQFIYFQF